MQKNHDHSCIMCINDPSSALTHSKMSLPATFFSLLYQFSLLLDHSNQHMNIYMLITPTTPPPKKNTKPLTPIPSIKQLLNFLFPFTAKFLQLSIFISNSSFSWNHTVCVFILIIPPEVLPRLVMACIYTAKRDGQTSYLIWFHLAFKRVDLLFSRTTYSSGFSS